MPRLGAALAYYTVFSMVPLLIMIITVIGLVYSEDAARSYIIEQVATLVGPQSAAAFRTCCSGRTNPGQASRPRSLPLPLS